MLWFKSDLLPFPDQQELYPESLLFQEWCGVRADVLIDKSKGTYFWRNLESRDVLWGGHMGSRTKRLSQAHTWSPPAGHLQQTAARGPNLVQHQLLWSFIRTQSRPLVHVVPMAAGELQRQVSSYQRHCLASKACNVYDLNFTIANLSQIGTARTHPYPQFTVNELEKF